VAGKGIPMSRRFPAVASMRTVRTTLFQFVVLALATGCVVTAPVASSQPPAPAPAATEAEPPGRVGKISLLAGGVTLGDTRSGDTEVASLNWPITTGHRLSTDRAGRAEVRIGSTTLRLDADTVVDFARVDDEVIQLFVQRGTVALRIRNRELLREIDVLTPRERLVFDDVGRYRVDVDRVAGLTAVTAFVGAARIASGRSSFAVASGQRGELVSAPSYGFQLVGAARDLFDDWVLARDQREDDLRSAQYVSRETTGIEALDEYGTWRTVAPYGTVWFPAAVPVGWAPYRHGRWAYIAPWGWTWIDSAPWGFAPFHYGRWAFVAGAWCWVPGAIVPRPRYAPALVAWYGAPGVSVSVTVGSAVGWFPLGPGEVYLPPYAYSPRYIRSINVQHVTNIHQITVIHPPPRYVHQDPRRATWAPSDAIVRQRPIQPIAFAPREDQVRHYKPSPRPTVDAPVGSERRRIVPIAVDPDGGGAITRPQPAASTPRAERDPSARGPSAGPTRDDLSSGRDRPPTAVPPAKPAPPAPGPRGMSSNPPQDPGVVARPGPGRGPTTGPVGPGEPGGSAPVARPTPWAAPPASGPTAPPHRGDEPTSRPFPTVTPAVPTPAQPAPGSVVPRPDPRGGLPVAKPSPRGLATGETPAAGPTPGPPRPAKEGAPATRDPRVEPARPDIPPPRPGFAPRGFPAREAAP
jgi:hypothetical protein